jgi:hypothetical protein
MRRPLGVVGEGKLRRPVVKGLNLIIERQIETLLGGFVWSERDGDGGGNGPVVLSVRERERERVLSVYEVR